MSVAVKVPSILLVEDAEEDIFFFRRALLKSGLNVNLTVAQDGKQALEILNASDAHRFDVVFLDLKMPVVNGYQVLEQTGDFRSQRRIYVLSGSLQSQDKQRVIDLGAAGFFVKPISADGLRDIVLSVVGQPV